MVSRIRRADKIIRTIEDLPEKMTYYLDDGTPIYISPRLGTCGFSHGDIVRWLSSSNGHIEGYYKFLGIGYKTNDTEYHMWFQLPTPKHSELECAGSIATQYVSDGIVVLYTKGVYHGQAKQIAAVD